MEEADELSSVDAVLPSDEPLPIGDTGDEEREDVDEGEAKCASKSASPPVWS